MVRTVARAHLRAILVGLSLALAGLGLSACGSSSSASSAAGASGSSSSAGSSSATSSSSSSSSSASSSSSSSSSTSSSGGSAPPAARGQSLTRALLKSRSQPPVTGAACVPESRAQRAKSPFGPNGPPVFSCQLRAGGTRIAYDVQLLANGCFVAERRKPGKAIYGCGAANAS
jgi:hypothetical protein